MTKINKIVVATAVAGFASVASAAEHGPKVTLGGTLDTQMGYRSEKAKFDAIENSTAVSGGEFNAYTRSNMTDVNSVDIRRQKFAIVNDTQIKVAVDGQAKGVKYGGKIKLNSDTSVNKQGNGSIAQQTMAYVESNMGRLEGGNYTGAAEALAASAGNLARAAGGIDGDARYWVNQGMARKFVVAPTLPTYDDHDMVANAAKVTYYTPSYAGLKAGVSFTPDSQGHGTIAMQRTLAKKYHNPTLNIVDSMTDGYKNVVEGGIAYNGKFDKFGVKLSATGEAGSAKKFNNLGANDTDVAHRHNLRAFQVGALVNYMGFGFGGSYGDWGKSGAVKEIQRGTTTKAVGGKKTHRFWTLGANYVHSNFGASLTYLNSTNGRFIGSASGVNALAPAYATTNPAYSTQKGKASAVSFGVDYQVAAGFMPYAEVTHFSMKDKSQAATELKKKDTATVFLAGTKLSF